MKLITKLKQKWIKGECRHICALCKYNGTWCSTDDDSLVVSKNRSTRCKVFAEGFDDGKLCGYNIGYTAAMVNMEKFINQNK